VEAAGVHDDYRLRDPKDVRVLVVGCTGYIGKYVTKELASRGYNVVAFTREQAGIKGKMGKEDIKKVGSWSQ
jgi:divinyl chlorophyllide a 8-vinyl-reductase